MARQIVFFVGGPLDREQRALVLLDGPTCLDIPSRQPLASNVVSTDMIRPARHQVVYDHYDFAKFETVWYAIHSSVRERLV